MEPVSVSQLLSFVRERASRYFCAWSLYNLLNNESVWKIGNCGYTRNDVSTAMFCAVPDGKAVKVNACLKITLCACKPLEDNECV